MPFFLGKKCLFRKKLPFCKKVAPFSSGPKLGIFIPDRTYCALFKFHAKDSVSSFYIFCTIIFCRETRQSSEDRVTKVIDPREEFRVKVKKEMAKSSFVSQAMQMGFEKKQIKASFER